MNKRLPDVFLSIMSATCCVAAVIALLRYPQLRFPVKQAVFASVFLCPALVLYALWRLIKRQGSIHVLTWLLVGLIGTGVWVWTVSVWMRAIVPR